jgi:nucleoside-diphosphate-sugar epimerase
MVLVTGGTGFLGSYIIKHLVEKGYAVRAIRRGNKLPFWIEQSVFDKVNWVEGDILDVVSLEDAMDGIDTVIHAAAAVSFAKADRKRLYQVNTEGTANVVNLMLEKNIRRLVYISSVAALGRTADGRHVNEERKWEESPLNTHYAISKHQAELQVWRGIGEGLQAVILNPSTILGYGDWNSSSCIIFKNIYKGFKWYTGGSNGYVDVEDVARAAVLMVESAISEQRFIVSAVNWPSKKMMETIAAAFGKKPPSKQATPFILQLAMRLEKLKSLFTGKKVFLTTEIVKLACTKTFFENDKIREALPGFSFTSPDETITRACAKYQAEQQKA